MSMNAEDARKNDRRNIRVLAACGVFVASMVGVSFAAVPLYDMFCRVTGYNGTTMRVEQGSSVILDQKIRVELDTNMASGLSWNFKALDRFVEPKIGETVQVNFRIHNPSDKPETGRAIFNVTPMVAGAYFNKLECFCFSDLTLKPGETQDIPVVFFIDPEIVKYQETKALKVITLSYTFYPSDKPQPVAVIKADGKSKNL
jgi:cytochrome c oxidase assembly protein subunit 11